MQNNGHAKEKKKQESKGLEKMHANLIKVVTETESIIKYLRDNLSLLLICIDS